jgi:hypothetical protein
MRKRSFLIVLVITLAISALGAWWCRSGTFSRWNFSRIRPGMSLEQVEALLGGSGQEIVESHVPGIVDWNERVDSPKRVKAIIAGERFFRWEEDGCYIIVSLKAGVVFEKHYWEPSL